MLLVEQKYELRPFCKSALERTQTYSLKEILAHFYPRKKLNGPQYGQTFFKKSSLNLPHKACQPQTSFELSMKTYDFAFTFQHIQVLLHYIITSENLNTQLPNSN